MSEDPVKKVDVGGYKDRFWYPRFWDGMCVGPWWKTLKAGGFRIAPRRLGMAAIVTALAGANSTFALMEKLFYGKKIAETKLAGPPIFIIGHWRSGTTLLHEYMILDPEFSFADTYACFTPSHFLISRYFMKPVTSVLMPKKRPIDNMAAGFDRPQEDEFALCALGNLSPYLHLLYANDPPKFKKYLTLRDIDAEERKEWFDRFDWFLRCLTVQNGKQLVLKSPAHTARIRAILERYPDAKFVHIHRDPYKLFPSTYNLWMRLSRDEGLQVPNGNGMDEYILSTFEDMYAAFEADLPLLKPGQFSEVSFRELTADPVATIEKVYRELHIERFEQVREKIVEFAGSQKSYKKNRFELDPNIAEQITQRWSGYIEKYGYERESL